jgi:hypothetical protein
MTLLNKKINIWVAFVVCLAALGLAAAGIARAMPSSVTFQSTAVATTTVSYLGNGTATSTYQIDNAVFSSGKVANMQSVDSLSLYVQAAASSTATQYTFTPQYSNNNIDWYGMGSQGTASAAGVIAVSTSTAFTWTPGTTATTSMVFNLPVVPTQHERIVVSASGAAGAVYAEITLKKLPNTP